MSGINHMCGIFGYLGTIEEKKARFCLDTLSHRGPDGYGLVWRSGLWLGHRRLAILDLTDAGKQPMSYGNQRYWITFNGEIYNFIEVKKELQAKGYVFQSDSDTEVILAAFLEWQERCLDMFNGMWALAIWDEKKQELFLSRDRFGKKPLYYARIGQDFAFASEMKALTPLLDKVEPDIDLIKNFKVTSYEHSDRCLVKGIKRFPAGYYAFLRDNELELKRHWCTLDHLRDVPKNYEDQCHIFKELFIDACKLRMRSDVPLGTALSGGLDSSAVISTIANLKGSLGERVNKNWQNAFIISFPGTPLDESNYAKAVTGKLGISPRILEIDPREYIGKLPEYIYLFEENYNTSPLPFIAVYEEMRKNKIVVTLDGHGADEAFGGYGFDIYNSLYGKGLGLMDRLKILDACFGTSLFDGSQFKKLPPKPIYAIKHLAKTWLGQGRVLASEDQSHQKWHDLDQLNKILYASTHETILPTLLRNYDHYSMISGVEIRMPFMDHRLISFAFSLPWTSKVRNGFSKAIIRDSLACFLPSEIVHRKSKIGFNSPMVDWIRGPLRDFFFDTISSQAAKNSDFMDSQEVLSKFNKVINDPHAAFSDGVEVWNLLSPFLWEQHFLKTAGEKALTVSRPNLQ